jgi:hypothetical protein
MTTVKIRLKSRKINNGPLRLDISEFKSQYRIAISNGFNILNSFQEEHTPDEIWEETKNILLNAAKDVIPKTTRKKKDWITEDTLKLINKRKQLKMNGLNTENNKKDYTSLCKDIQKNCRKDKNNFINNICKEIQEHADRNETKDLFRKLKQINKKFKSRTWIINDKAGNSITDIEQIIIRWSEYCKELYNDEGTGRTLNVASAAITDNQEPEILKEEVIYAIRKLREGKASGYDGISAEMLKALEDKGISTLLNICNKIWKTGEWPKDWLKSIFIPFHKKGSTKECTNYRTISLISHASKIMLYIINERLKPFISGQISPEQAGFVEGEQGIKFLTSGKL